MMQDRGLLSSEEYDSIRPVTGPALSGDTRIGVYDIASGDQSSIVCSSAEILIVAKLEKVSDTAYGKMIVSLCRIAPHV